MDRRSKRRRSLPVVALVLATSLFAGACSSSEPSPSASDGGQTEDTFKVAMALPGPINDQGFNQAGYIGLTLIEQLGAEISYVENVDAASQIETLQNLASSGADLVIAHGGQFTDAAAEVAAQFPDVNFTVFNGEKTGDNLNAYFIRYGVGSFLAGALAALTTQTGSVGFIGGAEIPPTLQGTAGFEAGAKSVNPDIEVVSTIVGDFNDAPAAKEAALAQIASGVDVIYAFVDAGLAGVTDAVAEAGTDVKLIGYIVPHCDAGDAFIADAIFDSVTLYQQIGQSVLDGTWTGGGQTFVGLENPDVVRLSACDGRVDAAVVSQLDDLSAGVQSGAVALPEGI